MHRQTPPQFRSVHRAMLTYARLISPHQSYTRAGMDWARFRDIRALLLCRLTQLSVSGLQRTACPLSASGLPARAPSWRWWGLLWAAMPTSMGAGSHSQ